MNQVMVGVFRSYRDGHEALRALQFAGLRRDDAHLYRSGRDAADIEAILPPTHDEDDAEYAAHGEHQGVIARNRFIPDEPMREPPPASPTADDDATPQRTLLVIRMTDAIKPRTVSDMLHEHGAIAVKDAGGHWHFSPFRKPTGT
jgi:hypothetical protein